MLHHVGRLHLPARPALRRLRPAKLDVARGVAASRGHRWAESVAQRRPDLLALPWPAMEGHVAELAARKVIDLSQDKRLFGMLLRELDDTARRRWDQLRTARRQ